ncbi:MAG: 4-(cytidine 5'-diphospho)-2-C-methyl-D-erythritol kinase [Deltaproteobacteria bacterium]
MYSLPAPAKINLYLKILRRREDGYHELDTAMAKLQLADTIDLEKRPTAVTLQCPGSRLPTDERNLAYRAARSFLEQTASSGGIWIRLRKNIPIAAGLGGGSSDAAAVLSGMNELFGRPLSQEQLMGLGKRLGADVSFFIQDFPCCQAEGIGEILHPFNLENGYSVLLVNPGFSVSTRWAYENFALTTPANAYILGREWQDKSSDRLFSRHYLSNLSNDLESVTCVRYPDITSIKARILQYGALTALMSGSGPTVFGIFDDRPAAMQCAASFEKMAGWTIVVTEFMR